MGGRRAGSKRNRTPPVTESKKLRNQSFSPPPLQAGTTQRQRAEPPSPDPSDSESLSGDSYVSSDNSQPASVISDSGSHLSTPTQSIPSSTLSPGKSNSATINITQSPDPSVAITPKIPLPPPIIISASLWRHAAPLIFQNQDISPIGLSAQSSSDGKICVKTSNGTQFRLIQKTLLVNKIDFHTFTLATDRQLKVVIKGIPTDISTAELEKELVARNFVVQLIKRFGPYILCSCGHIVSYDSYVSSASVARWYDPGGGIR
ncbi:hypothetical protein ACI65C_013516 [Semiaphis heraclei]